MNRVQDLLAAGAADHPWIIAELGQPRRFAGPRARDRRRHQATGAQSVKFHAYTPDGMTLDAPVPHSGWTRARLWGGRGLHDLYREAATPFEWHAELFARARERGLLPFSSPFDQAAVDLLEGLGCARCTRSPRPSSSTSRSSARSPPPGSRWSCRRAWPRWPIQAALGAARSGGAPSVTLLSCTAAYPSAPGAAHLANIGVLRSLFNVPVGLSDHTPGIGVAVAAVALGAVAVEKHVALSRRGGGVDSAFSLEPGELGSLVRETAAAAAAVRSPVSFGVRPGEEATAKLRRSLWVTRDVRAGEVVSAENTRPLRPAGGLPPGTWDEVMGRSFARDVPAATPLDWDAVAPRA